MIPTFVANRDGNDLTFACPYCKVEHHHGAGGSDAPAPVLVHPSLQVVDHGHRVPHCAPTYKAKNGRQVANPLHEHGYYLIEVVRTEVAA